MTQEPYKDVQLSTRCAKCGKLIIRGAMPYKKIGNKYYHKWCIK